MNGLKTSPQAGRRWVGPRVSLGTLGRLAVFAWSLLLVLLMPADRLVTASGLGLALNAALYPAALRRLFRWRWLIFGCLLLLPNLLWASEPDSAFLRIPFSRVGLTIGLRMALRALVIIVAADGFSSAVDIAEVAGLFERAGLPGLGFSMGVAVNLLPSLRRSAHSAWHALRMRGGLRRMWWRGLRLLLITVVANALRRAEEIALAAESRAFTPERARALPLRVGAYDWPIAAVLTASWLLLMLLP